MPLKLSLKPGEKFVLNGAVVQNGDRRGVLILQNKASVLREKDIMQVEEVNSPARRVYFPVMMMYLDETSAPKVYDEFVLRLTEFMGAIRNPEIQAECVAASRHVMAKEYYKALMSARKLVDYEERLADVASGVQDRIDAG
ncbi:MAG: flagellar biosynthesis repressor FlbT [Brevundimonas sp.]|uniref:flagellar biosynthesis repressor FlbT n=1 Tax=Brevundimonas sp. TaxID=1871086 RepID=UPI001A257A56|nr:flagellar biosynthesis repressor FlbT [Brevundimonas sp.]MBJ7446955.1 flagellar biosynthesis repressor FlbT [Brevundimonas sp.]